MRYLLTVLGFLATFLALTFGFNWWVDPYGYFGRIPFGIYEDSTFRQIKTKTVRKFKPDVVLFGASTAVGIDPTEVTGCRLYNASFNGARPAEQLYFIRNFLPPVQTVIVALDLFAFNTATEDRYLHPDFGEHTIAKTVSYALSSRAVEQSLWTMKMSRKHRGVMLGPAGNRPDAIANWQADDAYPEYDPHVELDYLRNAIFHDWRYSAEAMATVRQIRDELAGRGIRMVVYINPMGRPLLDMLDEMGVLRDMDRFRADVKALFPDAIDFSPSMTAKELFHKRDPLHFIPPVGQTILEKVLATNGLCGRAH